MPSFFGFLRAEGAAGPDEQLETLVCNHLALGQWELGRAALCQLTARGEGGVVSAAAILEAVARRVPPTWLPPAVSDPSALGRHHLRWWCAAQAGELSAATVPQALRASVELAVCAAELDVTFAEELPDICDRGRSLEQLEVGRTQPRLDQLRGWLLHGDTATVARAIALCELLHRGLPADHPSRSAVGELPFEVAAEWLVEAESGVRSRSAQQWGQLGLVWHRAGAEQLAQLSEKAMSRRTADRGGAPQQLRASDASLASARVAEGHVRVVASLLGSDSTQQLRQYCALAEQAGLGAPLPSTAADRLELAEVPKHFRSYTQRVAAHESIGVASTGSRDHTSKTDDDEAQVQAQLESSSRLEFWHDHSLYCKRHGLHAYGSVLVDGIRFILAGADDPLAELLAPMPTVVHAALLVLCWPTLCIWSDEAKRTYSVLAARISQVPAAKILQADSGRQDKGAMSMSSWVECAQCLCHYVVSAVWYADVYEKVTGSVLEAIINSSSNASQGRSSRDSTADLDGSVFCTLKHLDAGQCTVMELVLPVLDTDEWIGALGMLGKGGQLIDCSRELQLKAFICCYRLIRRPLNTQEQSSWLIAQLCSIQLDVSNLRTAADACSTCRHLLRASVSLQDWEHEAGGSRSPEYAQWVLRGVLTFGQEQMAAAAAAVAADTDQAGAAAVLEDIRGVQRAVSEAENRMAVLALLGSRIDIADSFSYVCWLLASPEQLLCECIKLGDFAYCEQIVQMFKMSTHHRNIVVTARCHQEWSDSSAFQLQKLLDSKQMKDAIQREMDLATSVSAANSEGLAVTVMDDPSGCDGHSQLAIGLIFVLCDLGVCSEISCEASSQLLSVCKDNMGQLLGFHAHADHVRDTLLNQSAQDHPCLAQMEQAIEELLRVTTALRKFPRFCRTLRSLVSSPSCTGWSCSNAAQGHGQSQPQEQQQTCLVESIAFRHEFSNLLKQLAQAATDESALVKENTHRSWCVDAASKLTQMLARGAWVQASYPFLPSTRDLEERATAQSHTGTGMGHPYLLAFFKEYLCKVQAALIQSTDNAENGTGACLSPLISHSLAAIIESEHGNPLEIVETILVGSSSASKTGGADGGASSASTFAENILKATPVANVFGLSIGGVLLESASGPWADKEPEGLVRTHSSSENLAKLSSASSVSTASGPRSSVGSLGSLLNAGDSTEEQDPTMQALRRLYDVSPILAVATAGQMATVDASPQFGEMAINSSAQLPSLRRWLVRRWMPRRMLHELTAGQTGFLDVNAGAAVAADTETNNASIVLSRVGGLDDCNSDLSTARTIIAAMQACGDIGSACNCADDLLDGGAPDSLLLALATYYDGTAADPEQRMELVERIRDPVDAAQRCLQWLEHWDTAECIPLLQHCLDQLESSFGLLFANGSNLTSDGSDNSDGDSSEKQQQSHIGDVKLTQCIAELAARKTELITYESILAETDEWGPWQQLDRMCRNDIGAAVSRLVQLKLYPHAHQVLAQYEHRATAELLPNPESEESVASDVRARLQRLHATVDRKELLSFVLSNRNGIHEALPLLSRSPLLEALRLCNSVINFVAGPEGSVHAEVQVVQIMLLLARRLSAATAATFEAEQLPTVADLEMRALGLRLFALLPDRWKAEARPLSASPLLIIESLLRCRELALVAELLAAFPSLVDSEMLGRYALAALLTPRSIDTLVNTTVIASYFEDSTLVPESPRAAPLHGGHHSDCPWLTGDQSNDELLRSCFEISGPPSALLAKRYLRLHGTDKHAAIGKAAVDVCCKLLRTGGANSTSSTVHNDAIGSTREAVLDSCRQAARQVAVYASGQLEKALDVKGMCADDEIEIQTELTRCKKLVYDIDILTELAEVAGVNCSLADLCDSVHLAQLCEKLMENDCAGLAVRLAKAQVDLDEHSNQLDSGQLEGEGQHNVVVALSAEKCRWRWGIDALVCGQYSAAREHLTPLILLLNARATPAGRACSNSSGDLEGINATNTNFERDNHVADDDASVDRAAGDAVATAVEEILQHLLVQPLNVYGRLHSETAPISYSSRPTSMSPTELCLGDGDEEFIWPLNNAGDVKLTLQIPAAVLMSADRLREAFYYLELTLGGSGDDRSAVDTARPLNRHTSHCHVVTLNFLIYLRQMTPALQYCMLREVPPEVFVRTVLAKTLRNNEMDQLEHLASLLQQLKQQHEDLVRQYLQASCDFLQEYRDYKGLLLFATIAGNHIAKAHAYVSLFCGLDLNLSNDDGKARTEAATARALQAEELLVAAEECYDLELTALVSTSLIVERGRDRGPAARMLSEAEAGAEAGVQADAVPEIELRRKHLQKLKHGAALQRALVGLTKPTSSTTSESLSLRDVTVLQSDARRVEMVAVQLAMTGRWALARRIPLTVDTHPQLDVGAIALRALGLLAAATPAQPVELELLMDQLEEEQERHAKAAANSTSEHGAAAADAGANESTSAETIEISQQGWNDAIIDVLRRKQHSAPSGGLPMAEAEALVARIWPPESYADGAGGSTTLDSIITDDVAVAQGSAARCEAWLLCRELDRAYSEAAKAAAATLLAAATSNASMQAHVRTDAMQNDGATSGGSSCCKQRLEPMRCVLAVARNCKDENMMERAEQFLLEATSSAHD